MTVIARPPRPRINRQLAETARRLGIAVERGDGAGIDHWQAVLAALRRRS